MKTKQQNEKKRMEKYTFNTANVRTIHICFKRTKRTLFINTAVGNSNEVGTSTLTPRQ